MKSRFLFLLVLIAALLAACGGGPKATDTPVPVKEGTQAAPPAAAPTALPTAAPTQPAEEYDFDTASDLSQLSSYRVRYVVTWETTKDGQVETGAWDMLEELVREPLARRVVWNTSGSGEEADSVEIIQIGQNMYMNSDSEWLSMTTSETDFFAGNDFLANPMELVAGNRGKLVQRGVMVNGVSTDRYTFDETSLGADLDLGAVSKATGEVWVSPTLNVVVKYTARFEGKDLAIAGGEEGWINVALDLTDINKPIEIKAPEGVGPALAEDIPVMEGAIELTAMSGMVIYKINATPDEVRAFYEAEMPAKGWTKAEEQFGDMLSFTKGERQATVMIQEEDGQTAVSVFTEE